MVSSLLVPRLVSRPLAFNWIDHKTTAYHGTGYDRQVHIFLQ
jgi:hypothetical protein